LPFIAAMLALGMLVILMSFTVLLVNYLIDVNLSTRLSVFYHLAVTTSLLCIASGLLVYIGVGMKTKLMKDVLSIKEKKFQKKRN
jgi:hypothetical protein